MVVPLAAFQKGDVYIDYAFEDAKFRYEKQTGRVFRRFLGQSEDEIRQDSDLYTQAILSGREITRDEYYADSVDVLPLSKPPSHLVQRWVRADAVETLRILELRAFRGGARVHVSAERRVEHHAGGSTYSTWSPLEWALDAETGDAVLEERVPWLPAAAEISRARQQMPVDQAALRAVTRDGTLLFFVLGRNWTETWDPDAGTVASCTATLGLWDARLGAWRWETSRTPSEMGCGVWLFESAHFELSFDESGIFGRVDGRRTSTLFNMLDGSQRPAREADFMPRPRGGEGTPIDAIAADSRRSCAVVVRGTSFEVWDLPQNRLAASLDLVDDEPTAATFLEPNSALVVGTARGRLLRFDW
jgi:hypothetical protein